MILKMERIDRVLGYPNLKIYQNSDFFSFSLDSVILGNFSHIRDRDQKIVDFCSGNAIVPLILSRRTQKHIDAVEIQKPIYELALKSVQINQLEDQISVFCEDIVQYSKRNSDSYDLVLCNPPYFKIYESSKKNISIEKQIARHEIKMNLELLCKCAKQILKEHGNFCLVHRSERLLEILIEFRKNGIEPKKIKFIHEKQSKHSHLVLIEGQKKGSPGLIIEEPFILYEEDGTMTENYQKLQKEVWR